MTLLEHALALNAAGLAVLPVRPNGTKAPAVDWKQYQHARPTPEQLTTWFTPKPDPWAAPGNPATSPLSFDGLGVITGHISGHLEMFEVEGRAVHLIEPLGRLLGDHGYGELWVRLCNGWLEKTPSGGVHWHYRVDPGPDGTGAAPNTKLARRPMTEAELDEHKRHEHEVADRTINSTGQRVIRHKKIDELTVTSIPQVLIETRGEGGFTVTAPSSGRTHPTGLPWEVLAGSPANIPVITVDERDALHNIARMLDQMPPVDAPPRPLNPVQPDGTVQAEGDRPGDEYNAKTSWDDILVPHGWTRAKKMGPGYGWVRPGKDPRDGISATTGTSTDGVDRLYVFSSSTEFETETPYTKFAAYTVLEHGGDYTEATRALRKLGYGAPLPISPEATLTLVRGPESQPPPPAGPVSPPHLTVVDGTSARAPDVSPAMVAMRYGPTEDGTARALVDLHAHELRYCPQRGRWLVWNGHKWCWDEAEIHREHIRAIARQLPESEGWKTYKKRALAAAGVTGIERHARTDPAITVHIDELDARPYELNTPGGIVDLRTGLLRAPDPDALHTRSTSAVPDFEADDSLLQAFLSETFGGDDELIGYVQRLFGLAAIGTVLEQILPFGYGSGANGKSTLVEAVMGAMGRGETGYAIAAAAEMLMVRKHSEHPAEIAQLAGARLVVCSELDDGQRFAEARIKLLTGRDSLNARFMRGNPFTFVPSHTVLLLGNHQPTITSGGPALMRRLRLLPFNHVVPEADRDPMLGEKLAAAAPVVLAWVARGAADYMAGGLRVPEAVKAATASYAHDQDTVGRFVEDECHRAPGGGLVQEVTVLRAAYERWCAACGDEPASPRRLTQELRDRFDIESVKGSKGRRFYQGITLLDAERSATPGAGSATHDDGQPELGWQR